jgi:hypothetical protein
MEPPVCPKCGSLGVGERCATCGTQLRHDAPTDMLSVAVPGLTIDGLAQAAAPQAAGKPGRGAREREAAAYLALQAAVLQAASQIFAAFITSGAVTESNQHELSDRAVMLATRMAIVVERYVQSDSEDW